ncbi:DUF4136 domain-containing protein [Ekhidna sp.]
MKFISICLIVLLMSCSSSDYVVDSDFSYRGKFHRYKSFDFAINENFAGSQEESELIQKYTSSILTAWGYEESTKKPDFYVYYSIYYENLDLKGYNQPELRSWSGLSEWYQYKLNKIDTLKNDNSVSSDEYLYEDSSDTYQPVSLALKEGTMLISFFDRKKGATVWQGYASGFFRKEDPKNARMLRSAVIKIMDEFRLPSVSS